MNQLDLVVKYAKNLNHPDVLNGYVYKDIMDGFNENNSKYKFSGTNTITIVKLNAGFSRDVNRDTITGVFNRQHNTQKETLTLRNYKEYTTIVDPADKNGTDDLTTAANVLKVYEAENRPHEFTTYYSEKLYEAGADFKNVKQVNFEAVSFDAMDEFMKAKAILNKSEIIGQRIAYMTDEFYTKLKQSDLNKRIVQNKDNSLNTEFESIDGIKLVIFYNNEKFKSQFDTSSTTAIPATDEAVQLHLVMLIKNVILTPTVIESLYVTPSSAVTSGKDVLYTSYFNDLFVLSRGSKALVILADKTTELNYTETAGTIEITDVIPAGHKVLMSTSGVVPAHREFLSIGWSEVADITDITLVPNLVLAQVDETGRVVKAVLAE
jgi:hypothetical protein